MPADASITLSLGYKAPLSLRVCAYTRADARIVQSRGVRSPRNVKGLTARLDADTRRSPSPPLPPPDVSAFPTPETNDSHSNITPMSHLVPMNDTIFYRLRDLEFGVDREARSATD